MQGRPIPYTDKAVCRWLPVCAVSSATFNKNPLIIDKPTFGSTELAQTLCQKQYDRITLVGLCTDICVISNALNIKSLLWETPIIVDANCCAGVTPESHTQALNAMKMCQIDIFNQH